MMRVSASASPQRVQRGPGSGVANGGVRASADILMGKMRLASVLVCCGSEVRGWLTIINFLQLCFQPLRYQSSRRASSETTQAFVLKYKQPRVHLQVRRSNIISLQSAIMAANEQQAEEAAAATLRVDETRKDHERDKAEVSFNTHRIYNVSRNLVIESSWLTCY